MFRLALVLIIAAPLIQCARSASHDVRPAPKTAEDLGWIATVTPTEKQQILKASPSATFRLLNAQQNLFEISHVSESTLRKTLLDQNLYKNKFIQTSQVPKINWSAKTSEFTSQDALDAMLTCRQSKTSPVFSVDSSFDLRTRTLQLGESVSLKPLGAAHPSVGGTLRYFWDMRPPAFSSLKFQKGISESQTFTPDSTGLYVIGIVAQSADLSCRFQDLYFMVTNNPEFSSSTAPLIPPDTNLFPHRGEVDADKAWSLSRGEGVLVSVLDSGIHYNHPELNRKIEVNSADVVDQQDEDGNGFPDDTVGWDFAGGDRFPFDDAGHGSHVGGLIASDHAGIAPHSRLLPVKIFDAAGRTDLATLVAAIYYSVDRGAQVINASLEMASPEDDRVTMPFPFPLVRALNYASSKNVFFITAAGNGNSSGRGYDIETRAVYPASINLSNTLTVAATSLGRLTSYSNFSEKLVHVAAPGGDPSQFIFSVAQDNPQKIDFVPQAGTSMATPIVAGIAALMLSANPQITPQEMKDIFLTTGTPLMSLTGKTVTGRLVNAEQAVKKALDLQPALM